MIGDSTFDEEKGANKVMQKIAKKEAKQDVMLVTIKAWEKLYQRLETKLVRARESKIRDLGDVGCTKDGNSKVTVQEAKIKKR